MKKSILLIVSVVLIFACTNQSTEQKSEQTSSEKETPGTLTEINNYAVVWDWATEGHNFILENLKEQSENFQKLFDEGIIENVYLNNYEFAKVNDEVNMATIMFFLKAKSEQEARAMLDEMKFVKTHVARYRLYPVGGNWLGRLESADTDKTFSFAAVWTHNDNKELIEKFVKPQFEQTVQLWNEGIIENAYFATENAYENTNNIPGMAYFVNAESLEEAKAILDDMIFSKEGVATYEIFPVGTFWLGSSR